MVIKWSNNAKSLKQVVNNYAKEQMFDIMQQALIEAVDFIAKPAINLAPLRTSGIRKSMRIYFNGIEIAHGQCEPSYNDGNKEAVIIWEKVNKPLMKTGGNKISISFGGTKEYVLLHRRGSKRKGREEEFYWEEKEVDYALDVHEDPNLGDYHYGTPKYLEIAFENNFDKFVSHLKSRLKGALNV